MLILSTNIWLAQNFASQNACLNSTDFLLKFYFVIGDFETLAGSRLTVNVHCLLSGFKGSGHYW